MDGSNDKLTDIKNRMLQNNGDRTARTKKVALFHDLSGYGRCALTVAIPVISALGIQPVPVPTALLSTHTGGFEGHSYLDLTAQVSEFIEHYDKLGIIFDIVYTGFLGGEGQAEIIKKFIAGQKKSGAYIIVDPVMADNGKVYSSYSSEMCRAVCGLAANADMITPNITEAFILCGEEYRAPPYDEEFLKKLAARLMEKSYGLSVVTGIEYDGGKIGAMLVNKMNNFYYEISHFKTQKHNTDYPGSGDLFTSVICGLISNGTELKNSIHFAVEFIRKVVDHTEKIGSPVREGLVFEKFLPELPGFLNL